MSAASHSGLGPWRSLALITVLGVTLAAIAVFGATYVWVWAPLAVLLFAVAGAVLVKLGMNGRWPPWYWLMAPAAGFGLLDAWQWISGRSASGSDTLTLGLQLAAYGCVLYLSLFAFQRERHIRLAGFVLWAFTGVLAAEAIWQFFTSGGFIYGIHDASYATPVGPFVYHNHFAGCIIMLFPLALAVAMRGGGAEEWRWVTHTRRAIVPALALAALVISQSRGGQLSLLGEGVAALALFWRPRRQSVAWSRWLGVAILLLAFAGLSNLRPFFRRFAQLSDHDPSAENRLQMDGSAWHIFRDHPWTGTGFGSFAVVYPAYQTFDNGLEIEEAHNEYVQTLAETGMAGMLCVVAFLAVYAWSYRQRPGHGRGSPLVLQLRRAALIGTIGLLLQSAVDFEFHNPANALLFFLLCGMAAAPALQSGKQAAMAKAPRARERTR